MIKELLETRIRPAVQVSSRMHLTLMLAAGCIPELSLGGLRLCICHGTILKVKTTCASEVLLARQSGAAVTFERQMYER